MDIRPAQKSDMLKLKELFKVCFNEKIEAIDYLFSNRINLNTAIVALVDNTIVSALYLIDANIFLNGKYLPVYYLYGASTHPNYRKNGYMSELIAFANKFSLKKGKMYSVLLPGNERLYSYYKKLGYKEFFKVRNIFLNKDKMKMYKSSSKKGVKEISFDKIERLRFNICSKSSGSIIWNKNDIHYAVYSNKFYNGDFLYTDNSYAICNKLNNNVVYVSEFICEEDEVKNLLSQIHHRFPLCSCEIRAPLFISHFENDGKIIPFGLIKPLSSNSKVELLINSNEKAYLGLTLD